AARAKLAEAQAHRQAWRSDRVPLAQAALDAARAAGWQPLVAEATVALGRVIEPTEPTRAEGLLFEALVTAEGARDAQNAALAATLLALNVGYVQRRPDEARRWARLALARAQSRGLRRDEAWAHYALGIIAKSQD